MQFTHGLRSAVNPAVYAEYESLVKIYQDRHVKYDVLL